MSDLPIGTMHVNLTLSMKLRLTSRDFLLLLGIAVAALIAVATLFYSDSLAVNPNVSKKKATAKAAVLVEKGVKAVSGIVYPKH
jgi:hypothetical protein